MVRFAAFAAWTRPGLVTTDKRCFKLTCLYQVRVFHDYINKWHPEHPAHVSEFECLCLGSNPGHKPVTKKKVEPLGDMGRSVFEFVVSAFKVCRDYSEKQILLHFGSRLFGRPTHVWPYPEFSSVNVGWSSYAPGTSFIPHMLLCNYVSPFLLF